jgi:DNA-binding response OmpR family regulator
LSAKPRILVVDDDETIRESVSAVLKGAGYTVDTAETGRAAIAASNANSYNLALIDIRLPDMEGVELLTAIRKTVPPTIKIIVTGYPSMDNAVKAVNKGVDGYMVKPFKNEELLAKIEEHLKKQQEATTYSEEKVAEFIRTRALELDSAEKNET